MSLDIDKIQQHDSWCRGLLRAVPLPEGRTCCTRAGLIARVRGREYVICEYEIAAAVALTELRWADARINGEHDTCSMCEAIQRLTDLMLKYPSRALNDEEEK